MTTLQEKSELLFFYDSKYSMPNGDPFTGEQRYDDATKQILVSDVRIKRFIRDYLYDLDSKDYLIYVINELDPNVKKASASAARMSLLKKYILKDEIAEAKKKADKDFSENRYALQQCIDVRLFGGISTEKKENINLTGPVQFALLNPSLNKVDLRMHQVTSVFASDTSKGQGTIGTSSLVPYALMQIHGWINPFAAKHTALEQKDVETMLRTLWDSVGNANTRSKSNQNSLLLLQVVYENKTDKLYGCDRMVKVKGTKREEEWRGMDDFKWDFSGLAKADDSDKVKEIRYYTEDSEIEATLKDFSKTKKMSLVDYASSTV